MTPVTPAALAEQTQSAADKYAIGWRDELEIEPDGTQVWKQTPLKLEDALHPQMGDHIVQAPPHEEMVNYLADVFRACASKIAGMLVLSDCGVFWDDPELKHHAPDLCVIPEVSRSTLENKPDTFHVAVEGTRPCLIVELVSPNTRKNDVDSKFEAYYRAGVPHYVILDRKTATSPWVLRSYRPGVAGYELEPLSPEGRLWLPSLGIWLGVEGQLVLCYDQDGNQLENYVDLKTDRDQIKLERDRAAAGKAQAEAERDAALARLRELEARLADPSQGSS